MHFQLKIMILGLLGAATYKLLSFGISGTKNKNSPNFFSFKYWIADRGNWNDMLLGAILFGIIAAYKDVIFTAISTFSWVAWIVPFKDNELLYFLIGLCMTLIIKLLRNLFSFIKGKVQKAFR